MIEYLGLFIGAFVAATLLPFSSEAALAGLLLAGHPPPLLWLIATGGNSAGAAVNWGLGRYLLHFQGRRWFPFKENEVGRAQGWFRHYGVWTLLLAWLPIVGDPLTFIAGLMRVRFWLFLLLVAVGKGLRYAAVIWLVPSP